MYDLNNANPGLYGFNDIHNERTGGAESLTLRSGYRVELYEDKNWLGEPEVIIGNYKNEEDSELEC